VRSAVVIAVLVILAGTLLAFREARLTARLRAVEAENVRLAEAIQVAATRLTQTEADLNEVGQQAAAATAFATGGGDARPSGSASTAIVSTSGTFSSPTLFPPTPPRPSVPEYDPTQPPPAEPMAAQAPEAEAAPSQPARRNWGQEQILGAPDTERAGDVPTAWASRDPDGGPEWLQAGFDREVDVVEVRVRETYNPGAISKVTAMVGGQETTLWEGTASGGTVPRDFVVRPPFAVRAQSVVVHLDTTRVSGWNEIDAVELVGRDGSRQWATSADASSTYAERSVPRER